MDLYDRIIYNHFFFIDHIWRIESIYIDFGKRRTRRTCEKWISLVLYELKFCVWVMLNVILSKKKKKIINRRISSSPSILSTLISLSPLPLQQTDNFFLKVPRNTDFINPFISSRSFQNGIRERGGHDTMTLLLHCRKNISWETTGPGRGRGVFPNQEYT